MNQPAVSIQTCIDWLDHHGLDDMRDALSSLIDTGLRIGELLALEWQDVDFKAPKIHVWRSKSAELRAGAMTGAARAVLLRRKVNNPHPEAMSGMTYKYARLTWQKLRAGIGKVDDREFAIHALRHTCCTRLVPGGDLRTVQQWIGHEDIKTTMRYARFLPQNLLDAASVLEQGHPHLRVV